ncbi:ATP-dependent nuclease [Umezawaea sp.]|uniref:ATP-dependent nuclease n=1 Tax=Umezawaea sp. TaxID=1955258 RepID=UPI002ED3A7B7
MKVTSVRIQNWKSFEDTGDIELGSINVLLGRNNSGKSAVLRAIHLMQYGEDALDSDIRIGHESGSVRLSLADVTQPLSDRRFGHSFENEEFTMVIEFSHGTSPRLEMNSYADLGESRRTSAEPISPVEPVNFIYPYYSKRKVIIDPSVDSERTKSVASDLRNLAAKVFRLADSTYRGNEEFVELCKQAIGFNLSTYAVEHAGQRIGISVGDDDEHIAIEAMGEGVSSMLGLIVNLCRGNGNLFLIEEPENDLHPEALKFLLSVIVEKSANNQFIVTTHSNIVTRYLGAAPDARLFSVESTFERGQAPTSTIKLVENTTEARIALLRQLGYELTDFDMYEGWLFLEEASAQTIIEQYLIPWFAPKLARIKVVSGRGVDGVKPLFNELNRLFLFTHLEKSYKQRAWVVIDGDDRGKEVAANLAKTYKDSYSPDHFRTWVETDFERYYPVDFQDRVGEAFALHGEKKRAAKKQLLHDVKGWCAANEEEARQELAASASEVIGFLREIEQKLFS